MNALLIFTMGPVQSFIAQARKTQDLYAGSYILSHLCRTAARQARDAYGAEIIYPDINNPSLPNRLVALFTVKSKEELQEIGANLEKEVRDEFIQMGLEVVQAFALPVTTALEEQLRDFLEIYWVGGEYEADRYADCYRRLESFLGAIKNTRLFTPGGEQGRKCSITGEHNALFYRGQQKAFLQQAFKVPETVGKKYLAPGEALSGIGFMKRAAARYFNCRHRDFNDDFPSTAAIALAASLPLLPTDKVARYKELFGNDFAFQFFYPENLTPKRFIADGIPLEKLAPAEALLKELYAAARERGAVLSRYYGLVIMDGDSMGEWVSGKNLATAGQLPDFQRYLTRQLGAYAREVQAILALPQRGRLVYCGGDDLLGFINLNYLPVALRELRQQFPPLERFTGGAGGRVSSTSAGVCIAHYKTPLTEVINMARRMEEKAKEIDGKDALAISVLKHSGEICQSVFKWQYKGLDPLALLSRLIINLASGEFSDTFIRNLAREFGVLTAREEEKKVKKSGEIESRATEEEMVDAEISRLLQRSCQLLDRQEADEKIKGLGKQLFTLYIEIEAGLANFLSFLDIAAFLSREVQVSNEAKD
ncbi:type III-B CRISPR-associated protein Cas10/Cmr2 [Moorella sp. Hama-1]|uniref:type III-B CRISPR-associated protein Cas10/Cmr2 n=1 Tax=Moorella sp. Hama-1 TaxID=2138101 RepID=UPI000D656353|nr:type III-B CRISPR-associated protein Cas10/Cmr2 [Moorella sp. Hama-1]BCV20504.1 type III-B CRISPR-associated protein Cas10/Cmr2 [Moorella sp. Hama-1]